MAFHRVLNHKGARAFLCASVLAVVGSSALHGQEAQSGNWASVKIGLGARLYPASSDRALGRAVLVHGGLRINSTVGVGLEGAWINIDDRSHNTSLIALVSPFRYPISFKAGAGIALTYSRVGIGMTAGVDYDWQINETVSLAAGADWLIQKYSSSETLPSTYHLVLITVGFSFHIERRDQR
jgi:hypothetical protein